MSAGATESWTVLELIRWTTDYFQQQGIETARLDAECLLAAALGCERLQLYVDFDKPIAPEERAGFRDWVQRRGRDRVPVALLLGRREFWSLPIAVPTIAPKADVWMPQLAVDGANRLWVVWSEQLGGGPDRAGNWDLYARVLSQGRWGSPVRLSADPRPDINHRVTTDAEGNIYLVWQAHPESNGDIHFRRFADGRWSEPVPVTSGPASDWFPDVAVDEEDT